MRVLLLSIVTVVCGCSSYESPKADGGVTPEVDAPIDMPDASVQPPPPPAPGRELAAAAGRMTGGAWTVDVHLGSVMSQSTITGGGWSVRGGTPIQP